MKIKTRCSRRPCQLSVSIYSASSTPTTTKRTTVTVLVPFRQTLRRNTTMSLIMLDRRSIRPAGNRDTPRSRRKLLYTRDLAIDNRGPARVEDNFENMPKCYGKTYNSVTWINNKPIFENFQTWRRQLLSTGARAPGDFQQYFLSALHSHIHTVYNSQLCLHVTCSLSF